MGTERRRAARTGSFLPPRGGRENVAFTLVNVTAWLRDGRPHSTVLHDYDGPEPKLAKGESITDAIERLRRRGRELKADLHRIRSAPFLSSHCNHRMREAVEVLATVGAPSVSSLVEFGRDIVWPQRRVTSSVHNAQPGAVALPSA
jgi:hypothetical protein